MKKNKLIIKIKIIKKINKIENIDTKHSIDAFTSQALMVDLGVLVKYLGLASEAARTNWFGLGCPAFCHQPSLSLIILVAVLSFILGSLATAYTFWTFSSFGLPPSGSPSSPASGRYSALAGYLHERRSIPRRRSH